MGRRVALEPLECRVRAARLAARLSQHELAERAGLTRQAIGAIEVGQYLPNTAVALRLAQALRCRVEELFALPERLPEHCVDVVATGAGGPRMALAHVGDRWIGYPLAGGRELQVGFTSADALLTHGPAGDRAQLLVPTDRLEKTAVLMGCDPSLGILSAHLARRNAEARLLWMSAASQPALDAVVRGEAHLAGTHLREADVEDFNLGHARQTLARTGGLVVEFARWELGLVVPAGNPKGLHDVADLARSDVRIVNREPGAGSRALLDRLLTQVGVTGAAVAGYERSVASHLAAALAVASGGADAAIALRATALACGLDFVPLEEVRFDFVIPRPHLEHPTVDCLLDVLQSGLLRAELGTLPGYDVQGLGSVRADLAPAA